jgi:hypothetical protein
MAPFPVFSRTLQYERPFHLSNSEPNDLTDGSEQGQRVLALAAGPEANSPLLQTSWRDEPI